MMAIPLVWLLARAKIRIAPGRSGRLCGWLAGLAGIGLVACGPAPAPPRSALAPPPAPPSPQTLGQFVPPGNTLAEARTACNERFPAKIGNYLAHAHCVNLAVEWFALPMVRHADLLRLQEKVREKLSEAIDEGRITPAAGAAQMARADRLIDAAIDRRELADAAGAAERVAEVEALIK